MSEHDWLESCGPDQDGGCSDYHAIVTLDNGWHVVVYRDGAIYVHGCYVGLAEDLRHSH